MSTAGDTSNKLYIIANLPEPLREGPPNLRHKIAMAFNGWLPGGADDITILPATTGGVKAAKQALQIAVTAYAKSFHEGIQVNAPTNDPVRTGAYRKVQQLADALILAVRAEDEKVAPAEADPNDITDAAAGFKPLFDAVEKVKAGMERPQGDKPEYVCITIKGPSIADRLNEFGKDGYELTGHPLQFPMFGLNSEPVYYQSVLILRLRKPQPASGPLYSDDYVNHLQCAVADIGRQARDATARAERAEKALDLVNTVALTDKNKITLTFGEFVTPDEKVTSILCTLPEGVRHAS
jgi:hypothetical protein